MIFTQHYLDCLSQGSYLIGDESSGRAIVVDPRRDIGVYLDEAAEHGLKIERVIETHIHADFLTGHLELAAATGAQISYSEDAELEFPVDPLKDGQRISLGEVTLEIIATPGHTPESISVVVYEHPDDAVPYGVLTGDTLFVGDVGRPDLLSGEGLSSDELARSLYDSLYGKLLKLPDATRVFPAHGAGSACGKQMSSETSSTIGDQRRDNYALQFSDVDEFVASITEGQSPQPRYFEYDSVRNREQRPLLDDDTPPLLSLEEVRRHAAAGAVLLDTREAAEYTRGHLSGAVNIGLDGRFAEGAGQVFPPDRDIVLVGDTSLAQESRIRLARVGFDRVTGQLDDLAGVFTRSPHLVETAARFDAKHLAELLNDEPGLQVVDVRNPGETEDGTIPGAQEIPLPTLTESLEKLDAQAPVVTYCASGYRSLIAASLLRAAGFHSVGDLLGGYQAWDDAGLAVR
ncbi:MBL fold metallo-hydrolase [Mycobacterium sp.]|uniref:MBL fold metallo-hydrolase n=1 Tax=Mycobacterium sp. TaxID=1785 RepID=UPI0025F29573|nr:MBL fold metallo-hydrolase [Mycobacterium sp.]